MRKAAVLAGLGIALLGGGAGAQVPAALGPARRVDQAIQKLPLTYHTIAGIDAVVMGSRTENCRTTVHTAQGAFIFDWTSRSGGPQQVGPGVTGFVNGRMASLRLNGAASIPLEDLTDALQEHWRACTADAPAPAPMAAASISAPQATASAPRLSLNEANRRFTQFVVSEPWGERRARLEPTGDLCKTAFMLGAGPVERWTAQTQLSPYRIEWRSNVKAPALDIAKRVVIFEQPPSGALQMGFKTEAEARTFHETVTALSRECGGLKDGAPPATLTLTPQNAPSAFAASAAAPPVRAAAAAPAPQTPPPAERFMVPSDYYGRPRCGFRRFPGMKIRTEKSGNDPGAELLVEEVYGRRRAKFFLGARPYTRPNWRGVLATGAFFTFIDLDFKISTRPLFLDGKQTGNTSVAITGGSFTLNGRLIPARLKQSLPGWLEITGADSEAAPFLAQLENGGDAELKLFDSSGTTIAQWRISLPDLKPIASAMTASGWSCNGLGAAIPYDGKD